MKKLLKTLANLDLTISAIILILLFLDVVLQVYSRIAPGAAPRWTVEMGSILLCALLWMGLGPAVASNSHIRFDMVINKFPYRVKRIFDIIADVVFIVFLVILGIYTVDMLKFYAQNNTMNIMLEWGKAWSKLPMLIGIIVAIVRLLWAVVRAIVHFTDPETPEDPADLSVENPGGGAGV